jgi:hypothetical protein
MVSMTDESFSIQARSERSANAIFAGHGSREAYPEWSKSHSKTHDTAVAALCPTGIGQWV